jgi:hypothetical protein
MSAGVIRTSRGRLAQLVRAARLHRVGREFESLIAHHFSRAVFCLSIVALLLLPGVARASEMSFGIMAIENGVPCGERCPSVMVAEGEITQESPAAFLAFAKLAQRERGLRNIMVVNSQGGSLSASLELGDMLRRIGATVVVGRVGTLSANGASVKGLPLIPGRCLSACVYMMAGGRQRIVPDFSVVGVHRIHSRGEIDMANRGGPLLQEFADDTLVGDMRKYLRSMGIRPELMGVAEAVAPEAIRRLSPSELKHFRLANRQL